MEPMMKDSRMMATALSIATFASAIVTGCSGFGGASDASLDTNYEAVERNAPMFFLDMPSTASANATFSITTWVLLKPGTAGLLPKLRSFQAVSDTASKTVKVIGSITAFDLKPGRTASGLAKPMAATESVKVSVPAGTYEVQIPTEYYTTEHPELYNSDGSPMGPYPQPVSTKSIIVQ